jgi:site-specific recombinase XerD
MAMDSKQDFLRNAESALGEIVTASDMNRILKALSDVLEGYEMRTIKEWTEERDDCLKCYLDALSVECRSQKTIDRYRYVIGRMMAFAKVPTRKITVYHLRSFISAEKERGIADRTLEGYREIFSAYFNWLQRESLIEKNPSANLGAIKCAKKEKKIYSAIDFENLNRNCKCVRDRAIINFLFSTGCRISEMIGLNRNDVDLDKLECIVHGKGDKERTVYLSDVAGMLLGEYLSGRKDDCPALFINRFRERLRPNGVRYMLSCLAKETGIEHVHPHKFRRTLATDLARHGMPIQEVAKILGHDKIDTTMQYVVLNKDDIKSSYRRYA